MLCDAGLLFSWTSLDYTPVVNLRGKELQSAFGKVCFRAACYFVLSGERKRKEEEKTGTIYGTRDICIYI
jgi:hypothetical protein